MFIVARKFHNKFILSMALIAGLMPFAHAENWRNENEIHRFAEYDQRIWESGHWRHEIRNRKIGWFWVVNDVYYPYEYPTYPNPYPYVPSPYLEQSQPPYADEPVTHSDNPRWFYCQESKSYYPYVVGCASGWQISAAPAQTGM
jgi:hypothetical protein